jgi:hypothetical protein
MLLQEENHVASKGEKKQKEAPGLPKTKTEYTIDASPFKKKNADIPLPLLVLHSTQLIMSDCSVTIVVA